MDQPNFLTVGSLAFLTVILLLGALALAMRTITLLPRRAPKVNPCIGAAGVSAVPMSARVVQDFVSRETGGRVNPLMPAMGPNVAGVRGTAVAAGAFLALLG